MNYNKYVRAFEETFDITKDQAIKMKYGMNDMWDSVTHMMLIADLEEKFNIEFDMNDTIELNSFDNGLEILREKYNVEF
ncbi:MAG: acyl carrier protein [Blautia sp.]|nr:acyl carrier protein [Blautia sp.]